MTTPGGQIPKFGIMQITYQFGPFDNAKEPHKYIQDKG